MHCHPRRVTQFVILCWTASILRAQQMNNQQTEGSNEQGSSYFFYQRSEYPRDCEEVRDQCTSVTSSGVHLIKPDGYHEPFEIYCDYSNPDSWTILLRRDNGHIDFDRKWDEYQGGFGFLSQEYWIGSERLSYLTNQKNYELRIDITNSDGISCYLTYDLFRTSDEFGNYKIANLGQYSGNADNCITLCPINMEQGDCSCQRTCANPSGCLNTCSTDDICVCSNGFYLKGEQCVLLNECTSGCSVDGVNVPEGGFYVNVDCTRRGVCNNGQLAWDDTYTCSSNEVCEVRNNVRQCYNDFATDCFDIYNNGFTDSDVYTISPTNWPGSPFQVYCNMTDEGGWTVFQRRVDGTVDFYRNWTSYKEGFGSLDHEHWLGNDKLYYLTNQKNYSIRIDLVNRHGSPYYAKFDSFGINNEDDNYRLSQLGSYSGTADTRGSSDPNAGIALSYHLNYQFSTYDRDNDVNGGNCAEYWHGAWWYHSCYNSNLNGDYHAGICSSGHMYWYYLPGSTCNVKFTEMKIRPL